MTNLLLIDADGLAYKAATGKNIDGWERNEEEVEQAIEYEFHSILNALEDKYKITATHYVMFLSGKNNFRKTLYPGYKANRKNKPVPLMLSHAREYIISSHKGFVCHGVEADDTIVATHNDFLVSPFFEPNTDLAIIVSQDKDFQGTPCVLFDCYLTRMEMRVIQPEDAQRFFYKQMLMGDSTDGITGIPKCGEKTAEKILNGKEGFGLIRAVYSEYIRVYKRRARREYVKSYTLLKMRDKGIDLPREYNIL